MTTPEQSKKIHTLLTKHGISDITYRDLLENRYSVSSSKNLDEEQASDLIEYLIETTGDTYDRTAYHKEIYREKLIRATILEFAEEMNKKDILKIFLSVTTAEQNREIVKLIIG